MGASRKLQGEIDRVLKKVQEGVDVFDSIWNKVYDTDNANQKEKFEADLKKEIKKLQRYRDQIKTWIQSSDIKDKKALMDARKLIEREMERFKICEKETKTKAFSKEGLGQQPKTDPKEKAKAETRDWLNNVVSELESQIDSYEAEIEGLTVKKGKMKPRLTHLETSIVRHKAHIIKLELILRLLDNDELSPEQVNDVKDFLDDYVERNQDDFDEFSDVDELYSSLPLDKVEALEDLVTIGPPGLVKGAGSTSLSLKTSLAVSSSQITAAATPALQQGSVTEEQSLEIDTQENSDVKTPSQKTSVVGSSGPSTPVGGNAAPVLSLAMQTLTGASITASTLPGSISGRDVMEHTAAAVSSTPSVDLPASTKEEDLGSFTGHRPSSLPMDSGIMKGAGRGSLASQASASVLLGSNSTIPNNGNITPTDMAKRNILSTDGRIGNSGMVQPLVSPLSNRMILSQATKLNEGTLSADSSSGSEAAAIAGRVFPSSVVSGTQWRSGSPFQTQNEVGQVRGRTELAPDQKENFLQRLQQIQQQGHSNLIGMPPLAGGNHKPFSAQQQNPLLQQFASQTPSVSSQVNIGNGVQGPSPSTVASNSMQLQLNPVYQPSQQTMMSIGSKEADVGLVKAEEQKQSVIDEAVKSVHASGKNIINEDDSRSLYTTDTPVVSSSLTEPTQLARDADLSPGQPLQPNPQSGSLGVIGRRSVSDLGAIGDNLGGSSVNSGVHDQLYNMQMLEAMYYKLPHPKDSERPRSYVPKHPVATPASYPQVQAPIVNNPVFWERLGVETLGTDTLFFAFYYQQNTYQQYLAAKELKKQSWRYHRKYNTWFQRHEEPKVATDEFEQGTYVYFDFHIADDNLQHGWCQRIKTEFTFEYNYLEDEL